MENNLYTKKYAIFDMDGTLIDSMKFWSNLSSEYLLSKGVSCDFDLLLKEVSSMTLSESSSLFSQRFLHDLSPETIESEMSNLMNNHYKTDIPLKKQTLKLLEDLKNNGVKMCVASTTSKALILTCLERLNVLHYFDFILSCEEYNTNKNEPTIYLEAAKIFNAKPQDISVFEDSLFAIQTAKNVNFHTVAVYDKCSEENWQQICSLSNKKIYLD